jgi:hypothetical protein
MLKWLSRHPELRCKRIKKNGEQCKKARVHGCSCCKSHGAHRIRYGTEAPNYRHGEYTKERLEESKAVRSRLGYLTLIGQRLGFLPRKRGRRFGS